MRFIVVQEVFEGLQIIRLQDTEAGTSVAILPEFGAMLHEFNVPLHGGLFNVIHPYKDVEDIKKDLGNSFKSSKLSPFACRIQNGVYEFDGRTFEFETKFGDGNAIHGLLYNKPFSLVRFSEENDATAVFSYRYDQQDAGFPWTYLCEITYTLMGNQLTLQTVITSEDKHAFPITDGWHPYFQLGGKADKWELVFPNKGIVEFNEKLIPTGDIHPYAKFSTPEALGKIELDNCFVLDTDSEKLPLLRNPENGLFVRFHPDKNYPYLQMYIPPHRESIAIENLSGAPDCFNNGMGLLVMEPGTAQNFTVTYEAGVQP